MRYLLHQRCLWFLLIAFSPSPALAKITFPSAPLNTPYNAVAALAFSQPDQVFRYGQEHDDQYVLKWTPASAPKGDIVFVHGGCWLSAFDIKHSYAFATGLAQQGYTVWSIEYRRTGNGGEWPVAFEDVSSGLSYITAMINAELQLEDSWRNNTLQQNIDDLGQDNAGQDNAGQDNAGQDNAGQDNAGQDNAGQDNADPNNYVLNLIGHSAGGHLALMAATDIQRIVPKDSGISINVVGLAAIVDITAYSKGTNSCQTATPAFMQGSAIENAAQFYLANPMSYDVLSSNITAVTLMHGSSDSIVPIDQAKHHQATQQILGGAGHFDWIHPGSQAFAAIVNHLGQTQ